MNKQEAIDQLEYLKRLLEKESKDSYNNGFINALKYTLNVVKQLKEQEKPKVPQFVADWYKDNQDDLEVGVYDLCVNLYNCDLEGKIKYWFDCDSKKPIETLVKMKLFGYEVEKEKLYEVFLKRTGAQLGVCVPHGEDKTQFTKVELQEYGFDNLDVYDVKEVEE